MTTHHRSGAAFCKDCAVLAPVKLKVKHDQFPENEIIINAVWCDIGGHKAHEDEMHYMTEDSVSVCEGCREHYE